MRIILSALLFLAFTSKSQSIVEKIKMRVDYKETPGIVVGIYENGKVTYHSFGVMNLQTSEAVTPKTLFEIGSITKTFTTSMAVLLSLENKIKFSDRAQSYLPSKMILPERDGKVITIEHLATAHSGLPRMPKNFSPKDAANPYVDYTEDFLTTFISNCELTRDPGAHYEYSNLGMGLLGYILTRIEEKPYPKLVTELITKPLDMNQTFVSGTSREKHLASGYADNTEVKAWTWNNESVLAGAGGLVSNAEDMMKFMTAQLTTSNTQLSKAFALTHTIRADAGAMKIGYGWHIRDEKIVWHNGGTGGFRSFAGFDKATNKAVVVLTNSTAGADDLGFHLLNEQYELKALKKPVTISEAVLTNYVGTYEIAPTFSIVVTLENGSLMIQATNQPKVNIYPESETKFYLKIVDAQIEFFKDATSKVEKLELHQGGAVMPGKKVK
ncbi:MAG: serine hydrolase [Cyclobacteriaceae bacterium]|nr:serine hydrolase [Cyclobacteriaceae bacterium]